MKDIHDFFRVAGSQHPFVKDVLPHDISTRPAVSDELAQLQVCRDALNRISRIHGNDRDGRRHGLEFNWVETDRVKAGEVLLLRGGAVETRVAVAWNRGTCSSRVFSLGQRIHLAVNGEADEKDAKIQLSYQGQVFEGVARESDKKLPFLHDLVRAVNAQKAVERMPQWDVALLYHFSPSWIGWH